ncbi:MAG: hypothetical protein RL722_758 [Pseudomonadota bacterium]
MSPLTLPSPYPGQITDIAGLMLGHAQLTGRPSGCSVLLCPQGVTAAVDVRGAAPGTRETELLAPGNLVEQVHAILLTGGSAYGLDAAGGVMRWLEAQGHGLPVGHAPDGSPLRVPIVPAAVLFDLAVGDGRLRPGAAEGHAACVDAWERARSGTPAPWGNVGAGCGATVGKLYGPAQAMKGGLGSAAIEVEGIRVAALAAVNAVGDVRDPSSGRLLAGARREDGQGLRDIQASFVAGDLPGWRMGVARVAGSSGAAGSSPLPGTNTTLVIVATDARLDKAATRRLAVQAHDGLARSIQPVHTALDGDTVFALATGGASAPSLSGPVLGALAAEVTARAVVNAVLHAQGLPGFPAARDITGR